MEIKNVTERVMAAMRTDRVVVTSSGGERGQEEGSRSKRRRAQYGKVWMLHVNVSIEMVHIKVSTEVSTEVST